jgi:hypothetical protein
MVVPRRGRYQGVMNTLAASPSVSASPLSLRGKAALAAIVLVPFTAFSLWVVAKHGYLGFLTLAGNEPWALQILLDLAIACSFGIGWVVGDARKRGLAAWPYVVATVFLGSIGILAYVVRRGLGPISRPVTPRPGT